MWSQILGHQLEESTNDTNRTLTKAGAGPGWMVSQRTRSIFRLYFSTWRGECACNIMYSWLIPPSLSLALVFMVQEYQYHVVHVRRTQLLQGHVSSRHVLVARSRDVQHSSWRLQSRGPGHVTAREIAAPVLTCCPDEGGPWLPDERCKLLAKLGYFRK